jgi:hypothetical protein
VITSHYAAVNSLAKIPIIIMSTIYILDIPKYSTMRIDSRVFLRFLAKRILGTLLVVGIFVVGVIVLGSHILQFLFGGRFPQLRGLLLQETLSLTGYIFLCLVLFAFLPELQVFEIFILGVGSCFIWILNFAKDKSLSFFLLSVFVIPLGIAALIPFSCLYKRNTKIKN